MDGEQRTLSPAMLRWYALGALPGGVGATTATFLVFYYNQVLGVPGSWVGLVLLAASLFDAVTDPLAGIVSDRTRSRWGRRHPYLFAMVLPAALCFWALWVPPSGAPHAVLALWLGGVLLASRLASTLYTVPYLALGAEITRRYDERNAVTAARAVSFNVGRAASGALLLLVLLSPTPEFPDGQMNPEGYQRFGLIFAGVFVPVLWLSAWKTRSTIPALSTAVPGVPPGSALRELVSEIREALRLRAFQALLWCDVAKHIAWGVSEALGLYMATYFWRVGTEGLFLWGIGFFTGIFGGLSFWRRFGVGREKKPIYVLGTVGYLVFFCLPYVAKVAGLWPAEQSPLNFALYVGITGFLAHFFGAASTVMGGSMLADVTDLDELRQGRRREGILFGAESLGWKALVGIGSLSAGFLVDAVGLAPGAPVESVGPEIAARLGLAQGAVMTALMVAALLSIRRYDLSRAGHAAVLAQLGPRPPDAGAPASR